ncbi:hypothetical protein M3P05_20835, partial [Sansalvadorimonas sp. 2012CJ34-2]
MKTTKELRSLAQRIRGHWETGNPITLPAHEIEEIVYFAVNHYWQHRFDIGQIIISINLFTERKNTVQPKILAGLISS